MPRPRSDPDPNGKLSPMQGRFVQEYVIDLNAKQAAIRAGYSPRSADSQGIQVLSLPKVQARIGELNAARAKRKQVDADFVLQRLVEECNADAGDLYDDEGRLKPVKQWPAPWRRGLVSSIRTIQLFKGKEHIGEMKDVVLVDRARRLELLGKHIRVNAFADKVTVGLDTPLQELFRQIAGNVIRPASERAKVIEHMPEQDDGE
jgi:phage terminase small subunit